MKKILCFVFGVAVLCGMGLSTGCDSGGGGDDGVGPIVEDSVFMLAVSASTGSGAAAFAAKVSDDPAMSIRSLISFSGAKVQFKVQPYQNGAAYGSPVYLSTDGITFDSSTSEIKGTITLSGSMGQYLVEAFLNTSETRPILQYMLAKTPVKGETVYVRMNASTTANVVTYKQWLAQTVPPTDKSFSTFEANSLNLMSQNAIETVAVGIQDLLNTAASSGNFPTVDPTNDLGVIGGAKAAASGVSTTPMATFSVRGYVTAADLTSGSEDTTMILSLTTDNSKIYSTTTTMGNFTISMVPNGTYTLIPSKANHSFSPNSSSVTINGADVSGQNFQAVYSSGQDVTAPTMASTDPANGSPGVVINKKLTVTFNEMMDSSSINASTFKVTGPGGVAVSGTVTSFSGLTAVFSPSGYLAANSVYTVTLTNGARDLAGNALAANYSWSFTTGAYTG
jgi:hypothetical protein